MLVSQGMRPDPDFWRGKRVLLTGHTGFKGSWLTLWLQRLGAQVTGLALPPATEPNLFTLAQLGQAAPGMEIGVGGRGKCGFKFGHDACGPDRSDFAQALKLWAVKGVLPVEPFRGPGASPRAGFTERGQRGHRDRAELDVGGERRLIAERLRVAQGDAGRVRLFRPSHVQVDSSFIQGQPALRLDGGQDDWSALVGAACLPCRRSRKRQAGGEGEDGQGRLPTSQAMVCEPGHGRSG